MPQDKCTERQVTQSFHPKGSPGAEDTRSLPNVPPAHFNKKLGALSFAPALPLVLKAVPMRPPPGQAEGHSHHTIPATEHRLLQSSWLPYPTAPSSLLTGIYLQGLPNLVETIFLSFLTATPGEKALLLFTIL